MLRLKRTKIDFGWTRSLENACHTWAPYPS